jgi:hypothetical protein
MLTYADVCRSFLWRTSCNHTLVCAPHTYIAARAEDTYIAVDIFIAWRERVSSWSLSWLTSCELAPLPPPSSEDEGSVKAACSSSRKMRQGAVCIRQHTSAYASIRQHMSAYVLQLVQEDEAGRCRVCIRQHTSAYVSIRQHTSAYVLQLVQEDEAGRCMHTSAYVSIRQHTSAYVSIRPAARPGR